MARQIHLADKKGRNALLNFNSFPVQRDILYVDQDNSPITNRKYVKYTVDQTYTALQEKYNDPNELANALLDGNPEIDLTMTGRYLNAGTRVYVNEKNDIVFNILRNEVVYDPEGEILEEREPRYLEANINTDKPLAWSGKMFPKSKVFNKFVFAKKYQIKHTNGLNFDMLYTIAKELHDNKSLMLVGSGKGTGPIVLTEGGNPFRAFLEGRIDGDKYLLLMHISNMELKSLNLD